VTRRSRAHACAGAGRAVDREPPTERFDPIGEASGSDVGVYQAFSANCCHISGNTLTDNRFFGIVIQDGDGTTRDNTITGGETGIGVVADAVDTVGVLRGDHISGTTVAPVREIECCGFTATAIVK
jgi:parallel beta-helix repeat protein